MNGQGRGERATSPGGEQQRQRDVARRAGFDDESPRISELAPRRIPRVEPSPDARPAHTPRDLDGYDALIQTVSDAVLVADSSNHLFLRGNDAALDLFGYDLPSLRTKTLRALLPAHQADEVDLYLEELGAAGAAHRSELILERSDGSFFWGEVRSRLHDGPTGTRYVTVVRDVTERVEWGQALRRAHADLAVANARVLHDNKLVALGRIVAGVAHELNNPASYVLMNLDELADVLERAQTAHKTLRSSLLAWLDGEQRERAEECLSVFPQHRVFQDGRQLVSECVDGVERITSLVRDLRGFARIDESDIAEVSMNELVLTACKMVAAHLRRRAHLTTRLESTRRIIADQRRLVQVVTNLLMNAAEAVDGDSPEAQVIEVSTFDARDAVILRVRDTGRGIAPDLQKSIFESFFTTKREQGTGLGLSLCSDIVRQHSGKVSVTSRLGAGATFEVSLPFDTGLSPAERSGDALARSTGGMHARILVIDDEPQLARAYQRVLSRYHHVTVATGGADALASLEKNADYDAVLCDLTMPDLDGVRIYRCLDRIAPALKPRVIFSSGGALSRRAEELLSSVDNPLLEKPVQTAKLLAAIERVRKIPLPKAKPHSGLAARGEQTKLEG